MSLWLILAHRNKRGGGPPSNVSRLSGAVARKACTGKPQIIHYHPGVGTEETKASTYIGGAFGVGVLQVCTPPNPRTPAAVS